MVSNDGFMMTSYDQQRMPRPMPIIRPNNKTNNKVTLMGQFNYISKNVSTWSNNWSEHIKDIVIATPEGTPIENDTLGRPMFYKKDNGFTSPYTNILKVLKENDNVDRLLYVHDDLLITKSTLRRIGRQPWVSTLYIKPKELESNNIITLYRNGTSFKHDSSSFLDNWVWWSGCRNAFMNMFDNTVVAPYLEKSNTDEDFINVRIGASDMLYLTVLTLEQRLWLIDILELFAKHSLFLECAIPTAVFWMKTRFKIDVHNANLCTDWGGLRGVPGQLIDHCNNEYTYDAFHPIKIGLVGNWSDYFNFLINR